MWQANSMLPGQGLNLSFDPKWYLLSREQKYNRPARAWRKKGVEHKNANNRHSLWNRGFNLHAAIDLLRKQTQCFLGRLGRLGGHTGRQNLVVTWARCHCQKTALSIWMIQDCCQLFVERLQKWWCWDDSETHCLNLICLLTSAWEVDQVPWRTPDPQTARAVTNCALRSRAFVGHFAIFGCWTSTEARRFYVPCVCAAPMEHNKTSTVEMCC